MGVTVTGRSLLAGGHLIVTTDKGEIALVKATPDRIHRSRALRGLAGSNVELSGDREWTLAGAQLDRDGRLRYLSEVVDRC